MGFLQTGPDFFRQGSGCFSANSFPNLCRLGKTITRRKSLIKNVSDCKYRWRANPTANPIAMTNTPSTTSAVVVATDGAAH
ncbi:hypothetical protein, partial [Acinetobacter baumannii]|uniref:hypothetical protein n=1 Tax=Acinetobacter baumannii TaxID=470 RepID=UPI001A7EECAA